MVAQAFAEHGTGVIVAEAARVGQGSTAASTALLLQEPDHDLEALARQIRGPNGAAHLAAQS